MKNFLCKLIFLLAVLTVTCAFAACKPLGVSEVSNSAGSADASDIEQASASFDDSSSEQTSVSEQNSSSEETSSSETTVYYVVRFYDETGLSLLKEERFEENSDIVFSGATPVKASDEEYDYVFAGWSYTVGGEAEENLKATASCALNAVFTAVKRPEKVAKPAADETIYAYNGEVRTYLIAANEAYSVSGNTAVDAGIYTVTVALNDKTAYVWKDGTTDDLTYEFVINKAQNEWTAEPSISDWYESGEASAPTGSALYGEVAFAYSDGESEYASELPATAGQYVLKASVAETQNYYGLEATVEFTVRAKFEVKFTDHDGEALYSATYIPGQTPVYEGESLGYDLGALSYTFVGWNDGENTYVELPAVSDAVNFVAVYTASLAEDKGTVAEPYEFTRAEEFACLKTTLENGASVNGKYFVLKNDVTLTTAETAIGAAAQPFDGNFNFGGFTVTYSCEGETSGLFAYNAGNISNVVVEANVTSATVAGGIAAYNLANGKIENVSVYGVIDATDKVGGIVGVNGGALYGRTQALVKQNGSLAMYALEGTEGAGIRVGETIEGGSDVYASSKWDGASVAEAFASGSGTENDPYVIETAEQLAFFKTSSQTAATYKDKYVALGADIDLCGYEWSGIAAGGSNTFSGTFDGKGHSVYNVNITTTGSSRGFINGLAATGTIKNVVVYGTVTATNAKSVYVGLINGFSYGTITDCTAYVDFNGAGKNMGGVTGYNSGNLSGCKAYGRITAADVVGGIVGYQAQKTTIGNVTDCVNYANVTATAIGAASASTVGAGGVLGVIGSGAKVTGCVNYGAITGAGEDGGLGGIIGNVFNSEISSNKNFGTVSGVQSVGGVAGYCRQGATVNDNENYGTIVGKQRVGGIAGYASCNLSGNVNKLEAAVSADYSAGGIVGYYTGSASTAISACDNYGAVFATESGEGFWIGGIVGMAGSSKTIENCKNYGAVTGKGKVVPANSTHGGGVGGVVGSAYNTVVKNCENHGEVTTSIYGGGIVGYAHNDGGEIKENVNEGNVVTLNAVGSVSLGGIVGRNVASVHDNTQKGRIILPENASEETIGTASDIIGSDEAEDGKVYDNVVDNED